MLALALTVAIALGLRCGTNVLKKPAIFDEPYIAAPVFDLLQQGWSVRTAIDFQETKGPGLIWPYAAIGEAVGSRLNDLRLISAAFFALGVVPLLAIARRCGVRGAGLIVVAALYALLPYHAVLGQMMMSEPSFVALSLAACWLFFAGQPRERTGDGIASSQQPRRLREHSVARIAATAAFAIVLCILLHNRVHALALAAGVCLTAWQAAGLRGAMPWALACVIAGLSRIPLWLRWGGLVSPRFQDVHGLGVSIAGQTYLLAAFAPLVAIFIWPAMAREDCRTRRWMVILGGLVGLALSLLAMPELGQTMRFEDLVVSQYAGIIATAVRSMSDQIVVQSMALGVLAIVGGAGLGALGALAWSLSPSSATGLAGHLQFWTLVTGLGMYAASATPVYDRYPLAWSMLLPIVWLAFLPRWLLVVQTLGLGAIAGFLIARWLI